MRYRDHRRGPPPWWPAGEPWPPRRYDVRWRHPRARFIRRAVFFFGFFLFLSAIGLATLVSNVVGRYAPGAQVRFPPFAILAVVFVVALVAIAARRIAFPLGDIVAAANRVADGDFSARITEHGPPTVRTVGAAFNSMAERLEAQDRQRRNLMADIAHELRTPLSVIQGRLEGLLDGVYPRDDATLNTVIEETRLLARLVEDLRTLANAESGTLTLQKEPTDFGILVQDVVGSFSGEAAERNVTLRFNAPAELPLVSIDPLRIREVVVNLLSNALRHTPGGGAVSIAAASRASHIVVSVADTGSGIPGDELPKVFERFYKGRTSRGSGLGLTIARNLVAAHGGEIRAENQQGSGAIITFTLPASL
jgi:two-component system OmpR family sensor kinase/two-component system sensor histidine kinase BaeS